MADKQSNQAMGKGVAGADDGVGTPDINGRSDEGESGGGAYPNPYTGKTPQGAPMGHGGQSEIDYHGGADEAASGGDENAVTEKE